MDLIPLQGEEIRLDYGVKDLFNSIEPKGLKSWQSIAFSTFPIRIKHGILFLGDLELI